MDLAKPNHEIDWHRTKLPKELLTKLNERSDWRGWLQTGGFLMVVLITGLSSVYFWKMESWGLFGLCLFLHGTVTSFCINAVHELVHGTVFKTKWLNTFFANLFGFIGIINPHMFWYSHTEHHKYTLHPPDDLEVVVPIYHSIGEYFRSFLINFYFYREFADMFRYCFGKFKGDWEPIIVPDHAEGRKSKVVNWSRGAVLGHLVIVVISIWSGWWIIPVLTTMSGAYGAWLFCLCNCAQHAGLTENIDDFRLNCRTIYINPITRFLYWNMNWHIEHHMYAAVPCYHLKKLHYAIKHELPNCPKGLIETWVEIAYIQYRRTRNDDYRFIAELPGEGSGFSSSMSRLQEIREQADRRLAAATENKKSGRRWECSVCGFIYDEAGGLPEEGLAPGTAWDDIPDDWICPDCGVSKAEFDMVEISSTPQIILSNEALGESAQPY